MGRKNTLECHTVQEPTLFSKNFGFVAISLTLFTQIIFHSNQNVYLSNIKEWGEKTLK